MTRPNPETAPPVLTVALFGPMQVSVDGRSLPPLHSRKSLALLALLALRHGRPVEREWLASALWPDSDQEQAFDNMRPVLSNLRKALGSQAERIQSPNRHTLCLELTGVDVDVTVFDRAIANGTLPALTQAVALYQGPLLEGNLEEWATQERSVREQDCLRALQALADATQSAGTYEMATVYYRRALSIAPLWEGARRGLMESLDQSGDRNAALQVYRDYVDLLKSDPKASPNEETSALYTRLRAKARERAAQIVRVSLASPNQTKAPEVRGYLPHPLTGLVGRDDERLEVVSRLRRSRLVTLTGTGGIGKTRLAIEVATEAAFEYADGVWLVALDALGDGAQITGQVAGVLGLKEEPGRTPLESLTDYLRSRRLLLVLDNCEHLVEASARLAGHLLRECPHVRILATSREALAITGETAWRVPSLAVPDPTHLPSGPATLVRVLLGYESVQLFLERAQAVRKDFALAGSNAPAIAQVCAQLEGIPLAIELAAARVRALTVEQIASRLDDHLSLLTGGSRTVRSRQQTLRAALDWSYDLLSEAERLLLGRLSVFAGGWTLEAAEQVCLGEGSPDWEILNLLASLVDKSLVVFEAREVGGRYRLLEMVRQYAAESLDRSGASEKTKGRHRDWCLTLAEEAEPHLSDAQQGVWHERLAADQDNLRAALAWCEIEANGAEYGLRLAGALFLFWAKRGDYSEGRVRLRAVLERPGADLPTAPRAKALLGAASLAQNQGDYALARTLAEESLEISRELGNGRGIAAGLNILGAQAFHKGDYASSRVLLEESLAISRELGNKTGIASALNILGVLFQSQSDYVSARVRLEESLSLFRGLGDLQHCAAALNNLGFMAQSQSDYARARVFLEESLEISRALGDKQGIATALNNLVLVAQYQGETASAWALVEESLEISRGLEDKKGIASVLNIMGAQAYYQGDFASARSRYGESLEISRGLGDKQGSAWALNNLGLAAQGQGDFASARALFEESLEIFKGLGDKQSSGWVLNSLGLVAKDQGDLASSRVWQKESLLLFMDLGQKEGIVDSLEGLGSVLTSPEKTARLWGAAEGLRESIKASISPDDKRRYDREIEKVRSVLSGDAFTAAWEEGRALTWEQAVAYALEETSQGGLVP